MNEIQLFAFDRICSKHIPPNPVVSTDESLVFIHLSREGVRYIVHISLKVYISKFSEEL